MLSNVLNLNCLYEKASLLRGNDKMKHKVNQPLLIFVMFAIAFAAFNCDEKPTDSNGDAIAWQQTALDSLEITALATHPSVGIVAGGCGPMFRSVDRGNSWTFLRRACLRSIGINSNGHIFLVGGSGIVRSTDMGETWALLGVSRTRGTCLGPIAFNASGEIFVGSGPTDESSGGIYRSVDNGDTWTLTSFPDSLGAGALAINANGDIFAGTPLGVFRSTDNGETWVQINNGFESSDFVYPIAIRISPVNQHIFAAVAFDGVYRSTDNGDTWVHTGLRSPAIETLVINSNGDIFAGTGSFVSHIEPEGIFYSNDNGNSWIQINDGLTNTNVFSLTVDSSGFVYAGTVGDGVFRTVKSITE